MKLKHLLVMAAMSVIGGGNSWAQTDVTSTYLVNPSFEILKAADGTTPVSVKTELSNGLYGWTVVSCSNYQVESYASKSSTGFPADGSGQITPTDGTYYYFNRQGWASKDGELKTTTSQAVPAGLYYFSFDYKAADYSNNNKLANNGTTLGINVYASDGSTKIASLGALRHSYSIANNGSNPGNDAYMVNAAWKKMGILFRVDEEQKLTFSIVQNLKNNGRSDVIYDNCRLVEVDEGVDITGMIANYDFEQKDANGWTNGRINNGQQYTGAGNAHYLDAWNATFNMNQKFDLPAGVYQMTAKTRGIEGLGNGNIYLNTGAENYSSDIEKSGSADNVYGNGWGLTTVDDIIIYNDATVTYGFYSECGSNKWAGADDFTLTYVRDLSETEKATAPKQELLAAINAYVLPETNIGSGTFQYPTDGIEGLKSKLETAKSVHDNPSATLVQVNEQLDIVKNLEKPALNAPTAGQRFRLNLKDKGTTTFVQSATAQSGYSVTFNATESNNYSQAFELTPVEGATENDMYTLSFTDNDGETRYICNGIPYSAGTGAYGIRTITDKDKALVVKVVATANEGEYNLLNTSTDGGYKKLGSNGGDFYTDDKYSTFTITAAQKATATLNVKSAGKYGTFIAPFNADAPEGVTLYTCNAVVNDVLTLEKADAITANTPYIVYSDSKVEEPLSDWGLATKDNYKEGYLTGVFTATKLTAGDYVMQTLAEGQQFYKVAEGSEPTLSAYKAYLTVPSTEAKSLKIGIAEETAIKALDALTTGSAKIYDINGREQKSLQKGVNIVNGVKVMVK